MRLPKIIVICMMFSSLGIFIYFSSNNRKAVKIIWNTAIEELPISKLKNLRYLDADEKKQLFNDVTFKERFEPPKVVEMILKISSPHVIVWFTNHFGSIPRQGFAWYKSAIFEPLKKVYPTFWLVDLAAWRFLSESEKNLLQSDDFVSFMNYKNLHCNQCPLIKDHSTVMQEFSYRDVADYQVLRASDFFVWMNQLTISLQDIDGEVASRLVRSDLRAGAARFSLRDIGYTPHLLDYQNMLSLDHTKVFPLLQFLEGIYYALQIVEDSVNRGKKECSIVFLLPNKEFTYYLVGEEKPFFDTFRNVLTWFIQQKYSQNLSITIYFYPFAYGNSFYDQPFEEAGPSISNKEMLIQNLK